MMLFSVTAFEPKHGQNMLAKLTLLKEDQHARHIKFYDQYAPNFILVDFEGTSDELAALLDMNSTIGNTGIIQKMTSAYAGYASRYMWEWLSARDTEYA